MRVGVLLLLTFAAAARGTIVDRVAIAAGTKVITASEIALRIRLTAFENGTQPDFSIAIRKKAAEQLIDQKLVEREMDVGRYPRLDVSKRDALVTAYAKSFFHSDDAAMDRALEQRGLSVAELKDDLARQADLLTFLSLRFRPAVQISDQQVRQYFQTKIRPEATGQVSIEDFRARIEAQLTNARADADMEAWLLEQRKRTHIEYLDRDVAP